MGRNAPRQHERGAHSPFQREECLQRHREEKWGSCPGTVTLCGWCVAGVGLVYAVMDVVVRKMHGGEG